MPELVEIKLVIRADGEKTQEEELEELICQVLPTEVVEKMPPEVRETLQAYFPVVCKTTSSPLSHPSYEKFTEAHIDKYLDHVQRDHDHDYELRKTNRWFYLAYACISIVAFIIGVVYLLPKDRELLEQLVTIIVTFAGGLGAGFGLSKRN